MELEQNVSIALELENALSSLRRKKNIEHSQNALKKAEIFFLLTLDSLHQKQIMPSELGKELNITLPGVTHHLNSLENLGYIERQTADGDRRVLLVSLSKKGAKKVKELKKNMHQKVSKLINELGEEDSRLLIKLITKISKINFD